MVLWWLVQTIAEESQSESKWKQLGELAMSAGKVREKHVEACVMKL